jgi:hypothetical protein
MDSVDGRLELVGTGLVAAKAAGEGSGGGSLGLPGSGPDPSGCGPARRAAPGNRRPRVRDVRRDSVRSNKASRPATSGSSGRRETRIRASRIASALPISEWRDGQARMK